MDINDYIVGNELRVIVKPNSKATEIIRYDEERKSVVIAVSAPPEDNKANKELLRFVSKLLKKRVLVKSGAASRQKVLKIF